MESPGTLSRVGGCGGGGMPPKGAEEASIT